MTLSIIDDSQKYPKFILPTINFLEQVSNDNLNLDGENSINMSFLDKNLDKKFLGFLKEDINPQMIDRFNDTINLEVNVNYNVKNKDSKESKKNLFKIKTGKKRKINNEEIQKRDLEESEHNKFSDSNMRRKCKHLVLKNTLDFINKKIRNIYNGNIGNGLLKKELQTINQFQKHNANLNFNKEFLTKTLSQIFSDNISSRYTNIPLNHNKMIINSLINEKDENKRIYFNKLFNVNFRQCLNLFIGKDFIVELDGLKRFEEIKNEQILGKYTFDSEEYFNIIFWYLNNFEEIINSKKPRKYRKSKFDK